MYYNFCQQIKTYDNVYDGQMDKLPMADIYNLMLVANNAVCTWGAQFQTSN